MLGNYYVDEILVDSLGPRGVFSGEKSEGEATFEHYLRDREVYYIAIDEAKRPVKIDKNFDFLVFSRIMKRFCRWKLNSHNF